LTCSLDFPFSLLGDTIMVPYVLWKKSAPVQPPLLDEPSDISPIP
jgi:hypothetical protein